MIHTKEDLQEMIDYLGLDMEPSNNPDDNGSPGSNFSPDLSRLLTGNYVFLPGKTGVYGTFAKGVHTLKALAQTNNYLLDRPLTLEELMAVRIDKKELFDDWFKTCTGIAYPAGFNMHAQNPQEGRTDFKIVPFCEQLINIDKSHTGVSLLIDYDTLHGQVVDCTQDKYDTPLIEPEFLRHQGWKATFNGNEDLMKKIAKFVYDDQGKSEALAFYLVNTANRSELRALLVNNFLNYSNVFGDNDLGSDVRFLAIAPNHSSP